MNRIKLLKTHEIPHMRHLEETLKSGFYAEGPRVVEFEEKISQYVSNTHTIALNSTSAALYLALYLSGVHPGKAVITTPMTSPGTNISIPQLGGKILWADVDPLSGNICPQSVGRLLEQYGDQVAAVIGVDWGGVPCDFDELREVIQGRAYLIEDAAHAICAEYKNQLVGAHADFTCFSFQAVKHITTGDGGLLTCNDENVYNRAKRLRWFGVDRAKSGRKFDEDIPESGFKLHMNDVAAAIGVSQLESLPYIMKRRREIAQYYENELGDFQFQKTNYDCLSAYLLFTLQVENRNELIKKLDSEGIEASPVFCRNDAYSGFQKHTLGKDNLVNTTTLVDKILCIPVGDWLTDTDTERIVTCLKSR